MRVCIVVYFTQLLHSLVLRIYSLLNKKKPKCQSPFQLIIFPYVYLCRLDNVLSFQFISVVINNKLCKRVNVCKRIVVFYRRKDYSTHMHEY